MTATRRGGSEQGPPLLLLHGMGATGAVWDGVTALAEEHWPGPWFAPDLGGHGRAARRSLYSFGAYAAEVAPLVAGRGAVVVVGHSMGGVVALVLASGWFGVDVRTCLGVGIKVAWTDDELAGAAALAERPARDFPTRDEAIARYLRVSGLQGLVAPDSEVATDGVTRVQDGWRLAHDPRSLAIGAPDMAGLLAAASAGVTLAAGAHDPMCPPEALRGILPGAVALEDLGHNAHVEDPAAVWQLIVSTSRLAAAEQRR